jgi:hypothetical protein
MMLVVGVMVMVFVIVVLVIVIIHISHVLLKLVIVHVKILMHVIKMHLVIACMLMLVELVMDLMLIVIVEFQLVFLVNILDVLQTEDVDVKILMHVVKMNLVVVFTLIGMEAALLQYQVIQIPILAVVILWHVEKIFTDVVHIVILSQELVVAQLVDALEVHFQTQH